MVKDEVLIYLIKGWRVTAQELRKGGCISTAQETRETAKNDAVASALEKCASELSNAIYKSLRIGS